MHTKPPTPRIKLDAKALEGFYAKTGSPHFAMQAQVAELYGGKALEIYFKLVEFTTQITAVIGVVAGFGFTAISQVRVRSFFVAGEGMLFAGMLLGIWLVLAVYSSELNSLVRAEESYDELFERRNQKFTKVWTELNTGGTTPGELEALRKLDDQIVVITSNKPDAGSKRASLERIRSFQRLVLYLLFGGCTSLLMSISWQ